MIKPISIFSKQYDYRTADPTWICFFCHRQSHYKGLGDLFGPYFVPSEIIKTPDGESSKKGASSKKGRRKSDMVNESSSAPAVVTPVPRDDGKAEIWFHEDCFIWVPCTHLIGGRLVLTNQNTALHVT